MKIVLKNGQLYKIEKIDGRLRQKEMSVYFILKTILERQYGPQDLYVPNDTKADTIPLILYSSLSSEPFSAYGNIGHFIPDKSGIFKPSLIPSLIPIN